MKFKKYISVSLAVFLISNNINFTNALEVINSLDSVENVISEESVVKENTSTEESKLNEVADSKTLQYDVAQSNFESTVKEIEDKTLKGEIEKNQNIELYLTEDIKDSFKGIEGQKVIIKSKEGKKFSIILGSELIGDITLDNVIIKAGTLYCNGHRTIFTENSEFTMGSLFGGAYEKNVDSVYVKINGKGTINSGSSELVIVGGCYKGSVNGNIYMEIDGDIKINSSQGGHYITGGNKETRYGGDTYTGDPLYVKGNIDFILGLSSSSTPHNVSGTHNTHVYGDLNITVKSGQYIGICGQREEPKKAIVDGNINMVVGDLTRTEPVYVTYNWGVQGAGESIPNSEELYQVGKDVNITTYGNLWCWEPGQNPGDDIGGITGAESAIVKGDVNIEVNDSHIKDIVGVDTGMYYNNPTIEGDANIIANNANLAIKKDPESFIYPTTDGTHINGNANITMNGGNTDQISAYNGEIKGKVSINLTGNPIITLDVIGKKIDNTFDREESVLNINQATTTIPKGIWYFKTVDISDNSNVILGNTETNAFRPGIYDVNIMDSNLTTNNQAYSKGSLTMDDGKWIANGYLYITKDTNTKDSKITMNDYAAFGYGYKDDSTHDKNVVTSNNDIYTFNNNSLIDKIYGNADITNSTWNVLVPTIISGNYKGTTNKLSLPAFVNKENYPDEKIPLEIVGEATGTTDVTLVDKTDITKEGKPIVGQNYINGLKTSEDVFRLANENAKLENLYFKKVADADTKNKADYDMWQVAKGDSLTLDYKFVSDDNNQTELPEIVLEEVKQFEEEKNHHDGDIIKIDELNKEIKDKDVEVANGTWYFKGWAYKENENSKYEYIEEHKIEMHKNIELVGVWHFEPNSTGGGGGGTIVTPPTDPDRIEGNDRIETSVETSKDLYPNGTNAVVLANCERYTDVLTADPFAIQEKASALLTYKYEIPEKTLKEIERLGAKKIYISGGYDAVSKKVVDELAAKGYEIFRFDGVDRYDTARKIAIKIREKGNTNAAELASGEDFPDALCMTPLAVKDHAPILLTKKDSIPKYTKQALAEWDIENIKIGGLEKAVSPEVEKQLKAGFEIEKNNKKDSNVYDGAKAVKRIGGEDRYETSAKLAKESYPDSKLGVYATGEDFPDALIAGNYAGTKEAPVLLVKGDSLPEPIEKYTKESKIKRATIIGGVNAVSDKVFNLIKEIINNK